MNSVCCCSLPVWKSFLKKGNPPPPGDLFGLALDPPRGRYGLNIFMHVPGHEHFIPTKFRKHPLSGSVVKAGYVFPYIYSWNSLTRSRWDQRKYFELSEVRVKHQLWTKLFFSIGVGFSTFRVMVYISYDVDTLYSWFCAFWRMLEHEINNNYETLIERYVCQSNEIWLVIDLWADQWR